MLHVWIGSVNKNCCLLFITFTPNPNTIYPLAFYKTYQIANGCFVYNAYITVTPFHLQNQIRYLRRNPTCCVIKPLDYTKHFYDTLT